MSKNEEKTELTEFDVDKVRAERLSNYKIEKKALTVLMIVLAAVFVVCAIISLVFGFAVDGNIVAVTFGIFGILTLIAIVVVFIITRKRKMAVTDYYSTSDPKLYEAFNEAERKYRKDKKLLSIYLIVFTVLFIISTLATIIVSFIADSSVGLFAIFTTGVTAVISLLAIVILLSVVRNVSRSACNSDKIIALMLEERKDRLAEKGSENTDN